MNLLKLQQMAMPMGNAKMFTAGGGSGGGSQEGGSTGTVTDRKLQEDYFKQLLGGASDWLAGGGMGGEDPARRALLEQMQAGYTDMATGTRDPSILQGQLDAQQRASQANLEKSTAALSQQANQAGGAGGSRQSIAEGIAAGEAATNLQNVQAQTIAQDAQQAEQRRMAGLQGLGQTFQGMQSLESDAERAAKSLGMFRDLIGGDMGGSRDQRTDEWGQSNQRQNQWGFAPSDERLKKNVKKVGEKDVGKGKVGLYEYEFKEGESKDLPKGKQVGVLAQEVEKVKPEAVKEKEIGEGKKKKKRKHVNYGEL